jgi:hypothetical protein
MLDERGVEYETNDSMGASETTWSGFTAYQLTPTAKLIMNPTPEQAIAATLGGGKLTAEQVRKAIFRCGVWDEHNAVISVSRTDMQAIADELNATLGGGECEAIHDKSYYKGIHGYCEGLKCSNCGESLFSEFKSCPWCGMTIRKAVAR